MTSGTVLRELMASSGGSLGKFAEEEKRQPKVINIASKEGSSVEDIKTILYKFRPCFN